MPYPKRCRVPCTQYRLILINTAIMTQTGPDYTCPSIDLNKIKKQAACHNDGDQRQYEHDVYLDSIQPLPPPHLISR